MWIYFVIANTLPCMFAFEIPDNQGKPENTINVRHLAYALESQGFSCEIILNNYEMDFF